MPRWCELPPRPSHTPAMILTLRCKLLGRGGQSEGIKPKVIGELVKIKNDGRTFKGEWANGVNVACFSRSVPLIYLQRQPMKVVSIMFGRGTVEAILSFLSSRFLGKGSKMSMWLVEHLRRRSLRAAKGFSDYNFRQYFLQRTKDKFAAFQQRGEQQTRDETKAFIAQAKGELRQLKRMTTINRMYARHPVTLDPRVEGPSK